MNCPKCGHPPGPGALECAQCGIVFAKWEPRALGEPRPTEQEPVEEPALEPEPDEPSPTEAFTLRWHHAAALILFLGAMHWGYKQLRGAPDPQQEAKPISAPEQGTSEAPPAEISEPTGYDPAGGLSHLDGLLQEIQFSARPYGVTITLDHIKHDFLSGAKMVHPAVLSYEGAESGLSIPERMKLEGPAKEAAGGARTRCLVGGTWEHGDHMPSLGEGASECWQRRTFKKNFTVGYPISPDMVQTISYLGMEVVLYERRVWQPNNGRWAPYSEVEEMRVMEHLIWKKYGSEAEREDQDKMRERIAKVQADRNLTNPEWKANHIKEAILNGYEARLLREGAQYRLAYMRSW